MITVHMIGNAHLDPVWLWRLPAGIGEAILTCRTAADLLDEYEQCIFTRSDVWVYEQIELLDPPLFERIKRLVAAGRWEPTGGWYIQPDCNLPTGQSFHKHMEVGRAYHERHFGCRATVGYNVDSFGHTATLPSLLRVNGYDSYVFMRPGPREKTLPASLFRWRSPTDGSEVTTWRIHERYNMDDVATLREYIVDLVETCTLPGVDHVMCFYGVGDHGGGPTRSLIEWIIENRNTIPGCELVFSSPRRFFDAVNPHLDALPVVTDELQMHAIGCYGVLREVKTSVRRAEHLAFAAERATKRFPGAAPRDADETIEDAWRQILFNQFHDILDGTSLPDAYVDMRDQIGSASNSLNATLYSTLFRALIAGESDALQRLMVYNPSSSRYQGWVAHEPWLDWSLFSGALVGPDGEAVPYQVVQQPSISGAKRMILWPADVSSCEFATYRMRHDLDPAVPSEQDLSVADRGLRNGHWTADVGDGPTLFTLRPAEADGESPSALAPIRVSLPFLDDESDTWSHDITGYGTTVREYARFDRTETEETGPIRAIVRGDGVCGRSEVSARATLHSGGRVVEIDVTVNWCERLTVAKLVFDFGGPIRTRADSVPGGVLDRPQNGFEYPVVDWTIVRGAGDTPFAIVAPDAFGLDGVGTEVRYTLLRSPAHAWQGRQGGLKPYENRRWTDRGEHRFRFFVVRGADEAECNAIAEQAHEPPIVLDWTVGMQAERGQGMIAPPWTE